jgi:hypothetical protein
LAGLDKLLPVLFPIVSKTTPAKMGEHFWKTTQEHPLFVMLADQAGGEEPAHPKFSEHLLH